MVLTRSEDSQAGQCHRLPDPVPGKAAVRALVRHPHTLDLEPACHFIFLGATSELQEGRISVSTCGRSKREPVPQSPGSLFWQAVRSQDCSGSSHAIFCLSPGINKLFLTQLGCSCVCRLLLWCGGQGWRTVEFPPTRQGNPAWGEDPQSDPVTIWGRFEG